jgi:hypothetical protein
VPWIAMGIVALGMLIFSRSFAFLVKY